MSEPTKEKLRIVAFQDADAWVAQCVDYDIAAQGSDLPTVRRRIEAVINAEASYTIDKHGKAFHGIDPAPDFYESMFNSYVEQSLQSHMDFRIAA